MSEKYPSPAELDDFQPVDPWRSSELIVKSRKLPHLTVTGATYFVTFRTYARFQLPPDARDLVMGAIQAQQQKSIDLDSAVAGIGGYSSRRSQAEDCGHFQTPTILNATQHRFRP